MVVHSLLLQNGCVVRRDHAENPDPSSITGKTWVCAEEVTRGILCRIHPTVGADFQRREVVQYVQGLIRSSLGLEVFPYGSVPLRTYLPDGDIDLTAISCPTIDDVSVYDVQAVLKAEEQNEDAAYEVKDVRVIDAEVKLVKCLVQNIVVDISLNQLGGLCTLCFLEKVDQLVGKDHLFKHSIILIKAWCYYESRTLGAHHGLISTYALETLVLYIFHLFHTSLNGPLAVLYRFLDYFSKFDWENYCVSLNGPVCIKSLPDIVADPPENGRADLLVRDEFVKMFVDMLSVSSKRLELNSQAFPLKHLNIIDPLKENNNLGRSVNRGSFCRIQSAFKFGAQRLGKILLLPREEITDELNSFFANSMGRHGNKFWTDAQNSALASDTTHSNNSLSPSSTDAEICSEEYVYPTSSVGFTDDCTRSILRQQPEDNYFVIDYSAYSCTKHEGVSPFCSSLTDEVPDNQTPLGERDLNGISRSSESLNSLLDLTGHFDSHFSSLVYGKYCQLFVPLWNVHHWENSYYSHLKQNVGYQVNRNHALGPKVNHVNPQSPFAAALNSEENRKRQGTGTFIPNMNYAYNRDRLASRKGRNQSSGIHIHSHKYAYDNGFQIKLPEINASGHNHDLSEADNPSLGNGKPMSLAAHQSYPSVSTPNANGIFHASEGLYFGSPSFHLNEGPLPNRIVSSYSGTSCYWDSASNPAVKASQSPARVSENDQQRVAQKSYQLKDEADFPPLLH